MRATILAALLLAGCASAGPRPVDVRIQRETVEVMRPCPVAAPDRPVTIQARDLPDDARDALRIVTAALLAWQGPGGYGDRAGAALAICRRGGG